jgi:hypothetical protein
MKEATSTKPYIETSNGICAKHVIPMRFQIQYNLKALESLIISASKNLDSLKSGTQLDDFLCHLQYHLDSASAQYSYMLDNAEKLVEDF